MAYEYETEVIQYIALEIKDAEKLPKEVALEVRHGLERVLFNTGVRKHAKGWLKYKDKLIKIDSSLDLDL